MLDRETIEQALIAAGNAPVVVALSGGGDSLALLHLLCERLGAAKLHAIVVDHGLRSGAAEDARRALCFANAAGVIGEIATLAWPHGPKRAQQAAREARYRALCERARSIGARVMGLGHAGDDQAETLLMRAAAGSGWRGLAAMMPIAPAPVWPEGCGMLVVRPLLSVRREALRSYLRSTRVDWLEDPANANPTFERVRTRARLAAPSNSTPLPPAGQLHPRPPGFCGVSFMSRTSRRARCICKHYCADPTAAATDSKASALSRPGSPSTISATIAGPL